MELYDPIILAYNKKNEYFDRRDHAQIIIEAHNAICGDSFQIYVDLNGDIITSATFSGFGCAVSKASTAILVEWMNGKPIDKVIGYLSHFLRVVKEGTEEDIVEDQNWKAFQKAGAYPGRLRCATLSWDATKDFFTKRK